MRQREHACEATLDGSGTFPGEAIRVLTLFVAQQLFSPNRVSLPRKGHRVGLHIDLFEIP